MARKTFSVQVTVQMTVKGEDASAASTKAERLVRNGLRGLKSFGYANVATLDDVMEEE